MTTTSEMINQDRRRLLGMATASIAVATAASLFPSQLVAASAGDTIRPFRVNIPEAQLADLRRRIAQPRSGRTRRPSTTDRRGRNSGNSRR